VNKLTFQRELDWDLFLIYIQEQLGDQGVEMVSFLSKGLGKRQISKAMNLSYSEVTHLIKQITQLYLDYTREGLE